jgi:hypothetical protein
MYRVAITLSPSVTQKFIRLGYTMLSINIPKSAIGPTSVMCASSASLFKVEIVSSMACFKMFEVKLFALGSGS